MLKDSFVLENKEFQKNIISAINHGKLVLFLGAGVSRLMGVPGWDDLANSLIDDAYSNYYEKIEIKGNVRNSKEKITIAYQEFRKQGREDEFFTKLYNKINPNMQVKDSVYDILAKIRAIYVTTNADEIFLKTIGEYNCHEDLDSKYINDCSRVGQNQLYFLHGRAKKDSKNTNVVFTVDSYVKKYNDTNTIGFLKELFKKDKYTILFLGYGMNEYELLDYTITKAKDEDAGLNLPNVYVLEGFCSNQEALFQARELYFDALGAKLIPYNMDKNGYHELINVLKGLLQQIKIESIMYYLQTEDIIRFCREYNDDNANQLLNMLINSEINIATEQRVADEIVKNDQIESWCKFLFEKNYFSIGTLQQRIKIDKREWPLLNILIRNKDNRVSQLIVEFLENLSVDQDSVSTLSNNKYYYICITLVNLIKSLPAEYIKKSLIKLIEGFFIGQGMSIVFDDNFIGNIVLWKAAYFKEMIKSIVLNIKDYDNNNGMLSYYLDTLTKEILCRGNSTKKSILFEVFIEIIQNQSKLNKFSYIKRIRNVEDLYTTYYYSAWKIIIEYLKSYINTISDEKKNIKINTLLNNKNYTVNKIGLYLLRKADIGTFDFTEYFKNLCCIEECSYELYFVLKKYKECLTEDQEISIFNVLKDSSFGLEIYEGTDDEIQSLKLAYLKLLRTKEIKKFVDKLIANNVKEYDFEKLSFQRSGRMFSIYEKDEEDYIISDDNVDNYIRKVKNALKEKKGEIHKQRIVSDVYNYLMGKNVEDVETFLTKILNSKDDELIIYIINGLFVRREKIYKTQYENIVALCVKTLLDSNHNFNENNMVLYCLFNIISEYKIENDQIGEQIYHCLEKYKGVNLDKTGTYSLFNGNIDYLNNRNFVVVKTLLNYLKFNYENKKLINASQLLCDFVNNESFRYQLCYELPEIIKLIKDDKETDLSLLDINNDLIKKLMYNENKVDAIAVAIGTVHCKYFSDDYIGVVKEINEKEIKKLESYKDIAADMLYQYVIIAYLNDYMDRSEVNKWLENVAYMKRMIQYVVFDRNCENWFNKLITIFWDKIQIQVTNKQIDIIQAIFDSADKITEADEKTFEIVECCVDSIPNDIYFNINIKKILSWFEKYENHVVRLIEKIFAKHICIDDECCQLVVDEFVKYGHKEDAIRAFNIRYETGRITSNMYSKYMVQLKIDE